MSEGIQPWCWWLDADYVAEVQLVEAYPERYNTEDGLPPYGADVDSVDWLYGWRSYIPVRFEIVNPIAGDCGCTGFVAYQERQLHAYETATPPIIMAGSPFADWWIDPATLAEQPTGLAVLGLMEEPPAQPSPDWDVPYPEEEGDLYIIALADELSTRDAAYVPARLGFWYQYEGEDAVSLRPPRELPIADLLAEVHEGLHLLGRE